MQGAVEDTGTHDEPSEVQELIGKCLSSSGMCRYYQTHEDDFCTRGHLEIEGAELAFAQESGSPTKEELGPDGGRAIILNPMSHYFGCPSLLLEGDSLPNPEPGEALSFSIRVVKTYNRYYPCDTEALARDIWGWADRLARSRRILVLNWQRRHRGGQ